MMRLVPMLLLVAACSGEGRARSTAAPPPVATPPERELAQPTAVAEAPSIYDLELPLRDQTGAAIDLAVHRGHPVVITMFYGSCGVACPRLVEDVREVVAAIPEARRADTRVLLVSFDPARDQPAQLAHLAAARQLDPAQWTLAVANADDARLLAAVLGIRYRTLPDGEFVHSAVITVLDAAGCPVARLDGLGGDRTALAALVP